MIFRKYQPNKPIFVRLGDEVVVDALAVTAIYRSGERLVVRLDGTGLMEVQTSSLHYKIQECIDKVIRAAR